MIKKKIRKNETQKRHRRIRVHIKGTPGKPRLAVYRSNKHIYVQLIDDVNGATLASASSLEGDLREKLPHGGNINASKELGKVIAQKAQEKGIKEIVFDRGGKVYHGRIAAIAQAARENGLQF